MTGVTIGIRARGGCGPSEEAGARVRRFRPRSRALYRGEEDLNPGGRHLALEFQSPADGQSLSGRVEVELRVRTPSDDEVASVELDSGGTRVPLSPAGPGLLRGAVDQLIGCRSARGGRLWLVHEAEDLPGIHRALERDLRTQDLVSSVRSAPRRARFHPVEVKCRRGRVKTASGFFY